MKIAATSDTHGLAFWEHIPECDVCILGGDISPTMDHSVSFQRQWLYGTFLPDLKKIPAKNIVFIAGNHDFYLYDLYKRYDEGELRSVLPPNIHYLRDSWVVIDGVKIYGTPWVVNLKKWAFNLKSRTDEMFTYDRIPNDVDILVSHAPAFKFCDTILEYNEFEPLGSMGLIQAIREKNPKVVLSGHIHSGNHEPEGTWRTEFRCVSLLNEKYKISYTPYVFEYPKKEELP